MKKLIDTHCHIYTKEFYHDLPEVISRARESGLEYLLLPNIDNSTVDRMLRLCDTWPDLCKPMIGLHPGDLDVDFHRQLDELKSLLDADMMPGGVRRYMGIGETGLDLYWDKTRLDDQIESFRIQIEWALEYDLPISIHSRESFKQIYDVLSECKGSGLRGVFHCFSGSLEEAEALMEFEGFMFGIGGVLTFKKSDLPKALEVIPLERVVLETDAPYLSPVPYRGKRNEPSFIVATAARLAEVYGCSFDEAAASTTLNARSLFRL